MADNSSDYHDDSNFPTDSGGAVTSNYQGDGSPDDFSKWDWKQVMAAITGIAAAANSVQGHPAMGSLTGGGNR